MHLIYGENQYEITSSTLRNERDPSVWATDKKSLQKFNPNIKAMSRCRNVFNETQSKFALATTTAGMILFTATLPTKFTHWLVNKSKLNNRSLGPNEKQRVSHNINLII